VTEAVAKKINKTPKSARSYICELEHRDWAYIIDDCVLVREKVEAKIAYRGAVKEAVVEVLKRQDNLTINDIVERVSGFNKQQIGQALKNLVSSEEVKTTRKGIGKGYIRYSMNGDKR
jgi:uncharacterized protein (DUF2344 family)